jgi:hypothetical protein
LINTALAEAKAEKTADSLTTVKLAIAIVTDSSAISDLDAERQRQRLLNRIVQCQVLAGDIKSAKQTAAQAESPLAYCGIVEIQASSPLKNTLFAVSYAASESER